MTPKINTLTALLISIALSSCGGTDGGSSSSSSSGGSSSGKPSASSSSSSSSSASSSSSSASSSSSSASSSSSSTSSSSSSTSSSSSSTSSSSSSTSSGSSPINSSLPLTNPNLPFEYRSINKIVDSSDNGYTYAYAPSIVYLDGKFHLFYCSAGSGGAWDAVRYVWSSDGKSWSKPVIAVEVSNSTNERAACDPSVVKFNGGDGNYFYLYYSGNKKNVQTVMFVARATSIEGPYKKYTERGTWVENASDPKIIIGPTKAESLDDSGIYGAGQQTVVNKGGILYSWFTDTDYSNNNNTFFSTSENGVEWSPRVVARIPWAHSPDVKFDERLNQFVMFQLDNAHNKDAYLARRYSIDGVNWTDQQILCSSDCFPNFSNNVGVSGDQFGHLIGESALIAYGAPENFNSAIDDWGLWNLAASEINPNEAPWHVSPSPIEVPNPVTLDIFSVPRMPVYRFFNGADYLMTTTFSEGGAAGFNFEGIGFNLFANDSQFPLIPIYRCYATNNHFLSADSSCEGTQFEGLIGYLLTRQFSGTLPVYRYYRSTTDTHLITTSMSEAESNGFVLEGMLGYVVP